MVTADADVTSLAGAAFSTALSQETKQVDDASPVYELRTYTTHPGRLDALHQRDLDGQVHRVLAGRHHELRISLCPLGVHFAVLRGIYLHHVVDVEKGFVAF